jgi:hypothetical protein
LPSGGVQDDSVDVVTLCAMRGVEYDIAFLSPICDMRRLTWEEEEQIRTEKKASLSDVCMCVYIYTADAFWSTLESPQEFAVR